MTAGAEQLVPPRLYIHVQSRDQTAGAEQLRAALAGQLLAGERLIAMMPRTDSTSAVRETELRCVTRSDCLTAPKLAAIIGPLLGAPPKIVDLSGRYPSGTGTRPGHFELWFGRNPIEVQSPGTSAKPALPQTQPANIADGLSSAKSGERIRLPFPITFSGPAAVIEGDIITLSFTRPTFSEPTYEVSIDGAQAAVNQTSQGIEVTVPAVKRLTFKDRRVPIDIRIGGKWRVTPTPELTVKSGVGGAMVWIALAIVPLVIAVGLWWRRKGRVRAASQSVAQRFDISLSLAPEADEKSEARAEVAVVPSLVEPPAELVDACKHGDGLLFLGGEMPSLKGLPTHVEILGELLEDARSVPEKLKAEGRMLLALNDVDPVTDMLANRLGEEALVAELARRYAEVRPDEQFVRVLPHIGFSGVITSSFARVVEAAWPKALELTPRSEYDFAALVRGNEPFVLRLRGNLDQTRSVNLTGLELGRAIDEVPGLRSTLSALFATRSVLFLGMDASTLTTALELAGIRSAAGHRHFALVQEGPGFDISADRFSRQYGIEFLRMSQGDDATAFLGRLAARLAKVSTNLSPNDVAESEPGLPAITHLRLENIGPFAALDVEFRNQWAVLLGNNGAGKSTILRAIALALSGDDSSVLEPGLPLLRRGAMRGTIELTVSTGRSQVRYISALTRVQGRLGITANTAPLQSGTIAVFGFPALRGAIDPVQAGLYGTNGFPHPRVSDVLPIIAGGVDDRGKSMKEWIFRAYARSLDHHLSDVVRAESRSMIDNMFGMLNTMTPGFDLSFARCDTNTSEILLNSSDGEIPLEYVSQGMSATIAWIGPMIQRLYEINGDDAPPEKQHAVLLIDEIDSHLHPAWQQRLVPTLKKHFPKVQVIATTHSPLMVGNLGENEVLRVVRRSDSFSIDYLAQSFIGYRFDQILTDEAFGLDLARSEQWTVRDDYTALLGKADRTPDDDELLERLANEMRKLPGASETPAERRAAADAEKMLQEAIAKAAMVNAEPQKRVIWKKNGEEL
ncbi:AAA family ATPase [Novosphingobium sp. BL-8A]